MHGTKKRKSRKACIEFFNNGICKYGFKCRFSHNTKDINTKSIICRHYYKDICDLYKLSICWDTHGMYAEQCQCQHLPRENFSIDVLLGYNIRTYGRDYYLDGNPEYSKYSVYSDRIISKEPCENITLKYDIPVKETGECTQNTFYIPFRSSIRTSER